MQNFKFINLIILTIFIGTVLDIFYLTSFYDILFILLIICWVILIKTKKLSGELFIGLALFCLLLMVFYLITKGGTLGSLFGEKTAVWAFLFLVLALYTFFKEK